MTGTLRARLGTGDWGLSPGPLAPRTPTLEALVPGPFPQVTLIPVARLPLAFLMLLFAPYLPAHRELLEGREGQLQTDDRLCLPQRGPGGLPRGPAF